VAKKGPVQHLQLLTPEGKTGPAAAERKLGEAQRGCSTKTSLFIPVHDGKKRVRSHKKELGEPERIKKGGLTDTSTVLYLRGKQG